MNHSLPSPTRRTPRSAALRLAVPTSWSPTLVWIAGIAVCLVVALATLPRAAWADDVATLTSAPTAALAAVEASPAPAPVARTRARCEFCGVVETIRLLEPVGTLPATYEFTVRLRDGSSRVSTVAGATATAWTVGDAIMLLGGT
jgi:hypothetical protein